MQLAEKIMLEAHTKGRAIAEVEERKKAEEHAASLRSGGLQATVENIG
jgi:ATP-dependent Clp protease adapter protein ClpS